MPEDRSCSQLSLESQIKLIPLPDYYIVIDVSEDTHTDAFRGHEYNMGIWPYDQHMAIWQCSHVAIWR